MVFIFPVFSSEQEHYVLGVPVANPAGNNPFPSGPSPTPIRPAGSQGSGSAPPTTPYTTLRSTQPIPAFAYEPSLSPYYQPGTSLIIAGYQPTVLSTSVPARLHECQVNTEPYPHLSIPTLTRAVVKLPDHPPGTAPESGPYFLEHLDISAPGYVAIDENGDVHIGWVYR
jgi:hypothetical protein